MKNILDYVLVDFVMSAALETITVWETGNDCLKVNSDFVFKSFFAIIRNDSRVDGKN